MQQVGVVLPYKLSAMLHFAFPAGFRSAEATKHARRTDDRLGFAVLCWDVQCRRASSFQRDELGAGKLNDGCPFRCVHIKALSDDFRESDRGAFLRADLHVLQAHSGDWCLG